MKIKIATEVVASVLMIAIVTGSACTTAHDREVEQAYQVALERMVQGHVYEMNCAALLPMAEQALWDAGFRDLSDQGNGGVATEWADGDDRGPIRYDVYAQQVSSRQCAVQFIRHERSGQSEERQRDVERELELIKAVDAVQADRIRSQALEEAEQATSD